MWAKRPALREVLTEPEVGLDFDELMGIEPALDDHARRTGAASPWYVRLLVGGSAWFAGLFLMGFVAALGVVDTDEALAISGALLIGGAIVLRRALVERYMDFPVQLALTGSSAGVILFLGGMIGIFDGPYVGWVILIATALLLLATYPDKVMRFTATFTAASALLGLLWELEVPAALDLCAIGFATAVTWIWLESPRLQRSAAADWVTPVGYGLTCALFGPLLTSMSRFADMETAGAIAAVGLGALLFGVALRVLRELEIPRGTSITLWLGGGIAALTLLALYSPGVMAALLALSLAFHRRQLPLAGLSACFLVAFGVAFYYHLDLSFQLKSAALVGGGVTLLALRGLLIAGGAGAPDEEGA